MVGVLGTDLGVKLDQILGLDSNKVFDLTLRVPCNDLATVTVGMHLTAEEAQQIVEVFTEYELHKKEKV